MTSRNWWAASERGRHRILERQQQWRKRAPGDIVAAMTCTPLRHSLCSPLPNQFTLGELFHVHSISLTFFLHLDLETLFEPARLALVPPRHVHDALAVLLADVVQVPAGGRQK